MSVQKPRLVRADSVAPESGNVAGGNGGGYDDLMEKRVEKLEEFAQDAKDRLIKIETRLELMVTKSDLAEAMNAQIKWVVGTAVVFGSLALTIMTYTLNNAVPKPPTPTPPQAIPIVIYAQQPASQPSPSAPEQLRSK